MNERVGEDFAQRDFRVNRYLFPQRSLNHFAFGKFFDDKIQQSLKPNRVPFGSNLFAFCERFVESALNNDPGRFPFQIREIRYAFCRRNCPQIGHVSSTRWFSCDIFFFGHPFDQLPQSRDFFSRQKA